ncbi:hypothetical protein [Solirubrobacter soli]|uniref:hypothetical protein n=1 Tax=Solirubrobacter soli TaxID=363832 RepID=UPI0003FE4D7F|nr:hypothetical protein [Solirubrobacter soli]
MIRRAVVSLALWAGLVSVASADEPRWRLEQPAPPEGAPFQVALGTPGSLTFWAPNRGLLAVEGNSVVPRGILAWDGVSWHTLATVCGGPGDTMRIAWAGPTEFWTVSEPSRPRQGSGTALCHFKDGAVVASYSTADNAADPYRSMNAAACRAADDCWFGGIGSRDPTGTRVGAFHLHWDGSALRTVYNARSGRAVTDLVAAGEGFVETVAVGSRRGSADAPDPRPLESQPLLLHRIDGGVFANDPFVPDEQADGGSELLAADVAPGTGAVWAVGGGAASGPEVTEHGVDGVVQRPPLAVLRRGGGGEVFREVELKGATFGVADRLEDVAAVPDSLNAWAALVPFADRGRTNAKALVARIAGDTGETTVESLPPSGSGRGAAARIAFPGERQGWMVTNAGWLFHYSDGTPLERDTEPAFAGPITTRPNEAAEQFVPDAAPADDSQLFAPPPVEVQTDSTVAQEPEQLEALIKNLSKPKLKGTTLSLSFTVTRKARIQLIASRHGRAVAKSPNRTFKKGKHTIKLKLSRKKWPTRLSFKTKELTIDDSQIAKPGDDTTVSSPEGG